MRCQIFKPLHSKRNMKWLDLIPMAQMSFAICPRGEKLTDFSPPILKISPSQPHGKLRSRLFFIGIVLCSLWSLWSFYTSSSSNPSLVFTVLIVLVYLCCCHSLPQTCDFLKKKRILFHTSLEVKKCKFKEQASLV